MKHPVNPAKNLSRTRRVTGRAIFIAAAAILCMTHALAQNMPKQLPVAGLELHVYKLDSGTAFPQAGIPFVAKVTSDSNGYFSAPVALPPGGRVYLGAFGGNAPATLSAADYGQTSVKNSTMDLNNGMLEGRVGVNSAGQQRVNMCHRSNPSSGAAYFCKPSRSFSIGGSINFGSVIK